MSKLALAEGKTLISKLLIHGIFLVILSLSLIFLMSDAFYQNWFGFLAISALPTLVVINAVWQFKHPGLLARISSQPWRGLGFTVFAIVTGLLIAFVSMKGIGHSLTPPTPFLMMFIILSMVMVMWQLMIFEGWPFSGMGSTVQGWAMLGASYVLAYLCYVWFFDFSLMAGIPESWIAIAPQGLFEPWSALVYSITTLGVLFAWLLLEFKPFLSLKSKDNLLGRQPFYGLLLAAFVLPISLLLFWLGTGYFDVDPVSFLVRGPVSFMFGMFLISDTTGNQAFADMKQPLRGILLIALSMSLGAVMCFCYEQFMYWMLDQSGSGASNNYAAELWLVNSMLSVTFPLILIYCHFFKFWPVERRSGSSQSQ